MDALKLLIADSNEEFREALAEALQGAYYVRTCADGKEALALLRSYGPDILVVDLMLPELDGISLLQAAVLSGICPMVLATSRLINDYVMESTEQLGVGYLLRRPCDVRATVAHVAKLSKKLTPPLIAQPDPRTHVSNLLLSLGIPAKRHGYLYLREAILLMAKNPGQAITKELYPAVGTIYNCDKNNIERSIRSAIGTAWEHRDDRVWQLYFPPGPDGVIPRPTNAAFISRLADSLNLNSAAGDSVR